MADPDKKPLDKAKEIATQASDRARALVGENADKIDGAVDKAAGFIDDKTSGKYKDKITKVQDKARDVVERIGTDVDAGPKPDDPETPG